MARAPGGLEMALWWLGPPLNPIDFSFRAHHLRVGKHAVSGQYWWRNQQDLAARFIQFLPQVGSWNGRSKRGQVHHPDFAESPLDGDGLRPALLYRVWTFSRSKDLSAPRSPYAGSPDFGGQVLE